MRCGNLTLRRSSSCIGQSPPVSTFRVDSAAARVCCSCQPCSAAARHRPPGCGSTANPESIPVLMLCFVSRHSEPQHPPHAEQTLLSFLQYVELKTCFSIVTELAQSRVVKLQLETRESRRMCTCESMFRIITSILLWQTSSGAEPQHVAPGTRSFDIAEVAQGSAIGVVSGRTSTLRDRRQLHHPLLHFLNAPAANLQGNAGNTTSSWRRAI